MRVNAIGATISPMPSGNLAYSDILPNGGKSLTHGSFILSGSSVSVSFMLSADCIVYR